MIDFLKYQRIYLFISITVLLIGVFSIVRWGYIYSIDFVGGTNLEYRYGKNVSEQQLREIVETSGFEVLRIDQKSQNDFFLRLEALDEQQEVDLRTSFEEELETTVEIIRTETVGPTIGAEALRKTAIAAGLAVVGILVYIAWAFKNVNFAVSAIIAMFHDILVVAGLYSVVSYFFGAEIDTLFVTALLTTMSFSVHDTIVVFDQIRDYRKRFGMEHMEEYANKALTETMVRSLNNSFTIMFMLLALVLLGGSTIKFFAVALLIGIITGTYSSPFVSVPIAVWLEKRRLRRQ